MQVALLIDLPPTAAYHRATVDALGHAAAAAGRPLGLGVFTTDDPMFDRTLDGWDAVVIGPGSPYRDEVAVWSIVRSARERGVPLVGT